MSKNIYSIVIIFFIMVSCKCPTESSGSRPEFLWKLYIDGYSSSGIVTDGDFLYFATAYSFGNPDHLFKVSKDGTEVLKFELGRGATFGTPVIYNDIIYAGSDYPNGTVFAIQKDSLKLIWKKRAFIWTTILSVDEAYLYCTELDKVHALDRLTGDIIWSRDISGKNAYNSKTDGARLYFATGGIHREDGYLYCINKYTGQIIFKNTLPYMESRGQWGGALTGVEIWNDYVYIPSDNRNLYCFNKNDGSLIWEFLADSPMETPPRISEGILYTGSLNRTCYAINANTGEQLWSFQTVGSINHDPPQFYQDYVIFMSGAMLIFNKYNGELIVDKSARTGDEYGYWNCLWDYDGKIYSTGYEEETQTNTLLAHQF